MRLLLDTHIALWAVYQPDSLPAQARQWLLKDGAEAYVSAASLWEIAIKNNKSPGQLPPVAVARADFARSGFHELAIGGEIMAQVETLPLHHNDPFDRLLIATAFAEPMHLITHDRRMAAYDPAGMIVVVC